MAIKIFTSSLKNIKKCLRLFNKTPFYTGLGSQHQTF